MTAAPNEGGGWRRAVVLAQPCTAVVVVCVCVCVCVCVSSPAPTALSLLSFIVSTWGMESAIYM